MKAALKRPLENESGFAVIIMVSLISVIVISYSMYAANYFLILTSEVETSKRVINGMAVMQQLAQNLITARQQYVTNGLACPTAPYTEAAHEACIKPSTGTKTDEICVPNPWGDPLTPMGFLCLTNPAGAANHNIIEVTQKYEQRWHDPILLPMKRFNFWYGEKMIAISESLAPISYAYPDVNELPTVAGAPTVTRNEPIKVCNVPATPSEECMKCNGGSNNPECFVLKVCVLPDTTGDGYADCGANEQWFWQMVAITNPMEP